MNSNICARCGGHKTWPYLKPCTCQPEHGGNLNEAELTRLEQLTQGEPEASDLQAAVDQLRARLEEARKEASKQEEGK